MGGPRVHYAKWNMSGRKTNTIWFHLCVESNEQCKQTKIETDSQTQRTYEGYQRAGVFGVLGKNDGGNEKYWSIVTK